jgi:hypothetical protein
MRRDYNAAIKLAVNALYTSDYDDMERALKEILEALDPSIAELMEDDEEAARLKVNGGEIASEEEEEIEMIVPESEGF